MANKDLLVGIDCGTQGLRTVVVNTDGDILGEASREFPINYPRPAWAEQNPEDWWQAARETVKEAVAQARATGDDVAGLSVDGTSCTVVACKRDGTPLRPAILWMDQRAHEEAAAITATEHSCLKYVSWQESPEWMIPKAWWLSKHEPEVFADADLVIEEVDWLMHKLTGRWTASLNNVTCKWNYARPEGGWPVGLLEEIGFAELVEKWPEEVLAMGAPAGELTAQAAEELGLQAGTPVAEGGIDAYAGMLGVGVVKPGRLALVMGTSTCHMALCDRGLFESHVWGPYPDALIEGTWILEGGQTATGAIVDWLADNFGWREEQEAEKAGRNRFEVLDEKAAAVSPGAEGLVVLDYWQGNRTPIRDPLARGVILGLSLSHGIGHVLRAIYEGTAMGTRHILADLAQAGFELEGIYACGGGTRSELWLQIHADVCQTPLYTTAVPEATALGTALCAAVGAGLFEDMAGAAERMVKVTRTIEPDPDKAEVYDFYFDKYLRTYPALKDIMHEIAGRN
ncbi:MAG: hypothetical protein J7M26_05800 [Armatimonadetes bacterium]|nr:hypothetical protein [Armatimonadota bacterium]